MAQPHDRDGLLRRIEAIAADVDAGPEPGPSEAWIELLAARLEAAMAEQLASEMAALREDLADALEDVTAGLQQQLAEIRDAIIGKPAGESG
jgi:hypothetical protein